MVVIIQKQTDRSPNDISREIRDNMGRNTSQKCRRRRKGIATRGDRLSPNPSGDRTRDRDRRSLTGLGGLYLRIFRQFPRNVVRRPFGISGDVFI